MIITKQAPLNALCARLKSAPFITVDTEFLREKTYYPKLCLMQISAPDGNAAAIDPLADELDLTPLYDLLSDKNILKVFHAARQDLEIFYRHMKTVPSPVFDTQVAAMVCGYGESVGYDNIVRQVTGTQIDKSSQFTDWSRRPLSDKQINYALGDVTHLIDVYRVLYDQLETRGRTHWVTAEDDILADPATYQSPPEDAWKRVKIKSPKPKNLAVLKAVAAWRETRAQTKDLPRPWVLKDDTLAAIALQMPQSVEQLGKTRGFPKGLTNSHHGAKIIGLIKDALNSDPSTWAVPNKRQSHSPSVKAQIEILKMLLKIQAAEHGVAAKLIAHKDDIEAIAMGKTENIPALKGWRFEVFGQDALDLRAGKIAIGLKGDDIVKHVL